MVAESQTPEISFRIAGAVAFLGSQQLCRLSCGVRYWLGSGQTAYGRGSMVALFRRLCWWASVILQVYCGLNILCLAAALDL